MNGNAARIYGGGIPSSLAVGFALTLGACSSRSVERVAPADSGPHARTCQQLRKRPDPAWGNALEKHAHWNVSLSKDPHGETLGVVNVDWTFWVASDNAYPKE